MRRLSGCPNSIGAGSIEVLLKKIILLEKNLLVAPAGQRPKKANHGKYQVTD